MIIGEITLGLSLIGWTPAAIVHGRSSTPAPQQMVYGVHPHVRGRAHNGGSRRLFCGQRKSRPNLLCTGSQLEHGDGGWHRTGSGAGRLLPEEREGQLNGGGGREREPRREPRGSREGAEREPKLRHRQDRPRANHENGIEGSFIPTGLAQPDRFPRSDSLSGADGLLTASGQWSGEVGEGCVMEDGGRRGRRGPRGTGLNG